MGRNITTDDGASLDHSPISDADVRQNYTMRTNEHVPSNCHSVTVMRLPGAPVKVSKDSCSKTYRTILPNRQALGVQLVKVDELSNPYILSDFDAALAMKPRPQATAARREESKFLKHPAKQEWNRQIDTPLIRRLYVSKRFFRMKLTTDSAKLTAAWRFQFSSSGDISQVSCSESSVIRAFRSRQFGCSL